MDQRRVGALLLAVFFAASMIVPAPLFAAHTYDTKAQTAGAWAAASPTTVQFTPGTGATIVVLMINHTQTSRTGGTPTYGGQPMTQVGSEVLNAQEVGVEVWYYLNPPAGESTISVPNNATPINMRATAASFKAQAGYGSAFDRSISTNVDATTATLTTSTTADGDVCISHLGHGDANQIPQSNFSYSATMLYNTDDGALVEGQQYYLQATSGSVTMSITALGSDDVAYILACFKEAPIVNVSPTGVTATASIGALEVAGGRSMAVSLPSLPALKVPGDLGSVPVAASYGTLEAESEAGAVAATATLVGEGAAASVGNVVATGGISQDAALSGAEGSASFGTLTAAGELSESVTLAGLPNTASPGSLLVAGGVSAPVALGGQGAAMSDGSFALGVGANASISLASLPALKVPGDLGGGHAAMDYGEIDVDGGVSQVSGTATLVGESLTASIGSLAAAGAVSAPATLVGEVVTASIGNLSATGAISTPMTLVGEVVTASIGNLSALGETISPVALLGIALKVPGDLGGSGGQAAIGTLDAAATLGNTAALQGIGLSLSAGDLSVPYPQDATVVLRGFGLKMPGHFVGNATACYVGDLAASATGSGSVSPAGQTATASIGSLGTAGARSETFSLENQSATAFAGSLGTAGDTGTVGGTAALGGQDGTASLGTLGAVGARSESVGLSGAVMVASLGDFYADGTTVFKPGWRRRRGYVE